MAAKRDYVLDGKPVPKRPSFTHDELRALHTVLTRTAPASVPGQTFEVTSATDKLVAYMALYEAANGR
jgi:hypothetical protein